jgi:NAD(P)H-dependent flavin oxidoreductase YrpB (nitropropane dioxygenase family)
MGSFSLIPQVVDAVDVPVIAAGGIADGRGLVAALALGAEAVQIGTAFLPCVGSGASTAYRAALLSETAKRTDLTDAFSGRLARGIRNRLMNEFKDMSSPPLPFPNGCGTRLRPRETGTHDTVGGAKRGSFSLHRRIRIHDSSHRRSRWCCDERQKRMVRNETR